MIKIRIAKKPWGWDYATYNPIGRVVTLYPSSGRVRWTPEKLIDVLSHEATHDAIFLEEGIDACLQYDEIDMLEERI